MVDVVLTVSLAFAFLGGFFLGLVLGDPSRR